MRLRDVLSVLSKSSPYAVKTDRETNLSSELDKVKDYLYIETDMELDFRSQLQLLAIDKKKIIFLCGSSGDGKSEVLTRCSKEFDNIALFHLDATHSFSPKETAIERLNMLFANYENGDKSLVIGINIGMLGNYAEEGNYESVKSAISNYLERSLETEGYVFLDFEKYPKFKLESHRYTSYFTEKLLKRITGSDDNIIRQYYDKELQSLDSDLKLCVNYHLLSLPSVQELIIELLFKARLMKDQFLTARALLDFVYHLLTGKNYLFENIFTCQDSEIVSKIADFDPALKRTKLIDQFVLRQKLGIDEPEFEEFKLALKLENFDLHSLRSPESNIRFFYLLQNENLSNNYHQKFKTDFSDNLLDKYATIWRLHKISKQTDSKIKIELKSFYRDVLLSAISKYINRNTPHLGRDEFLLTSRGDYLVTTHLDIKQDNTAIKLASTCGIADISHFLAFLKVDEQHLKALPININLLELLIRIVEGYQPNKHDKNAVVLLDELLDELQEIAARSKTLFIIRDQQRFRLYDSESNGTELEVSGG
jgi:DNA phosphorothioation-dependent restriction protein DptF